MNSPNPTLPIFLVLLCAGLVGACSPSKESAPKPKPKLALEVPELPAADWQAFKAEVATHPITASESLDRLLAAAKAKDRLEARLAVKGTDPRLDADYIMAHSALQNAALDHAHFRAPEEFTRVGRARSIQMIQRFEALLAWCRKEGTTPKAALALDPWPPVVAQAVELSGSLALFGEQSGLLDGARPVGQFQPLLHGIYMEQWIGLTQRKFPTRPFITSKERQWFLRWQVERNQGGSVESRVKAAEQLKKVPGYPAELNAGVLLFNGGFTAKAAQHFARSKHPKAAEYAKTAQ